jgi:hypothetical protein
MGSIAKRLVHIAALLVLAPFLTVSIARAEATPTPETPDPSLCTVAPRSFAEIQQTMATPQAATPIASPNPALSPVSPEDAAAVSDVVRELVACFNAGEPLRVYGLYTDAYLRHLLSIQGVPNQAGYAAWATPEPLDPDKYVQILAIRDISDLLNGGVRAVVTLRYAGVPVPKTFAFDFAKTADGWRIDALLGEIDFSLP